MVYCVNKSYPEINTFFANLKTPIYNRAPNSGLCDFRHDAKQVQRECEQASTDQDASHIYFMGLNRNFQSNYIKLAPQRGIMNCLRNPLQNICDTLVVTLKIAPV